MTTTTTRPTTAATALSTMDTARVLLRVPAPVVAQGPIIRRPAVTAWAARHGWDARAGLVLDDLRRRFGPGPVLLRLPGRHVAVLLAAEDVGRMLDESPEPFAAAAPEKRPRWAIVLLRETTTVAVAGPGPARRHHTGRAELVLSPAFASRRRPVLAAVLDRYHVRLRRPTLDPEHLPMALDHFRVQLGLDRAR